MDELIVTFSPKEHTRIFAKIFVNQVNKCWEWQGSLDKQGYGLLWYKQKTERIHRVMYAFFIKPIPRGIKNRRFAQVDHLCRNHACCNPEHLELIAQRVNVLRGISPPAIASRRINCIHGHSLEYTKNGKRRRCRTCDRNRIRKK